MTCLSVAEIHSHTQPHTPTHTHTECINLSRCPLVLFNPVLLAGVQTGVWLLWLLLLLLLLLLNSAPEPNMTEYWFVKLTCVSQICLLPFCLNVYTHLLRAPLCIPAYHVGSWKNGQNRSLGKVRPVLPHGFLMVAELEWEEFSLCYLEERFAECLHILVYVYPRSRGRAICEHTAVCVCVCVPLKCRKLSVKVGA